MTDVECAPGPGGRSRRVLRRVAAVTAGLTATVSGAVVLVALAPGTAFAAPTTISYSCDPGPCPSSGTFTQSGVDVAVSATVDSHGGVLQLQDQTDGSWQTVDSSSQAATLTAPTVTTNYLADGAYNYRVTSNAYDYRCGPLNLNTCHQDAVTRTTAFTIDVPRPSPSPSPSPKPTGSSSPSPSASTSPGPSGSPTQSASPGASPGGSPTAGPSGAPSPSPSSPIKLSIKPGKVPSTNGYSGGSKGILGLTKVFGTLAVPGLPAPAVAPTPEGTFSKTLNYGDQNVPERYRARQASADSPVDSTTGQLSRAIAAALVLVLGSAHLRLWLRSPAEDEDF